MKQQTLALVVVLFALVACGKDKPKAVVATADAGTPILKQDDALAAKLAVAYPKIRCALAANQGAIATLYTDVGFADAVAYLSAFEVQAAANPAWAHKVTSDALAKPCVEPAAAATPTSPPAEPPTTGNTP